ncbi:MAG: hypothetical protein ACTSX9_04375 [Candidatus Njordarchaeales archaeon]
MSQEIKTYKITARYRKLKRYFYVSKEVRAISLEKALEKFFSEVGSQGLKRLQLEIVKIKEVQPEEMKNLKLRKIALADKPAIWVP